MVENAGYFINDKPSQDVTVWKSSKRKKDGSLAGCRASEGCENSRRYRAIFHFRERMALWSCDEPAIVDPFIISKFKQAFKSGRFGPRSRLTRGGVMWMCRDLGLCKYKECWKTILKVLTRSRPNLPDPELVDACISRFNRISDVFDARSGEISFPLKGARGQKRHNICHLNYTIRKILESYGNWEWAREFPLLRTPSKIHALDDAMKTIMQKLGFDFQRTAVIAIPKCKSKKKKKKVKCVFSAPS
jgi:hypothetical protein